MTLSQGDRLGRYEILGPIGAAGMGEVLRARDTELGRDVAIKVLPAEVAASPERQRLFEREAQATAALNHPNILTVHDVGVAHDQPYIVTELLEGETLRQVLRRGPCAPTSAVCWSLRIARGLGAAHAKGIVHRDLKPDNVFLTTDNRVKILDFGLAKILEPESDNTAEDETITDDTASGSVLGTMSYMAPEQLRGDPVDGRTDFFALGCALYEMLSGRRPFAGGSSAEHVSAVLRDDPAPLDEALPANLRAMVRRCLEKRPAARYQGVGEVIAVLESFDPTSLSGVPGHRPPSGIRSSDRCAEPAVAVMSFANLSGDTDQEYLCDGMAEEILGAIGKIRGLQVLAWSSSFAFKGKDADPREVGRTIGADHLLEGSVHRLGDRIRISARLVQATNGVQLWANRYDCTISDVFTLQDEISVEVANQLRTALLPDEQSQVIKRRHLPDREAYDLYMRGRFLWNRRAEGDVMRAITMFEQAIAKDPAYPEPHLGIAEAFNVLGAWGLMAPPPAFARSRKEIATALELGEPSAASHSALGFIAMFHDYDKVAAVKHLKLAMDLEPESALFHCWMAALHNFQGKAEEATAEARRALELEPLSPLARTYGGYNLYFSEPEEGLHQIREGVSMDPGNPVFKMFLGICLGDKLGRFQEAIEPLIQSVKGGWLLSLGPLGSFQARLGNLDEATRIAEQVAAIAKERYVSPQVIAWLAAGRGDVDSTLDAVEACVEATGISVLYSPCLSTFSFVHDHPRFRALMRRIGYMED